MGLSMRSTDIFIMPSLWMNDREWSRTDFLQLGFWHFRDKLKHESLKNWPSETSCIL